MAGLLYKFDLTPSGGCGESAAQLTTCHMEVYSVPWRDTMEVLWEKTTCSREDPELDPASPPCVGCAENTEVDRDILDFALSQLSYGECQKSSITVQNFQKQVDETPYRL